MQLARLHTPTKYQGIYAPLNGAVVIPCEVPSNIFWHHNNQFLSQREVVILNEFLVILNLNNDTKGEYQCLTPSRAGLVLVRSTKISYYGKLLCCNITHCVIN